MIEINFYVKKNVITVDCDIERLSKKIKVSATEHDFEFNQNIEVRIKLSSSRGEMLLHAQPNKDGNWMVGASTQKTKPSPRWPVNMVFASGESSQSAMLIIACDNDTSVDLNRVTGTEFSIE